MMKRNHGNGNKTGNTWKITSFNNQLNLLLSPYYLLRSNPNPLYNKLMLRKNTIASLGRKPTVVSYVSQPKKTLYLSPVAISVSVMTVLKGSCKIIVTKSALTAGLKSEKSSKYSRSD
jgi:hypothetical protein